MNSSWKGPSLLESTQEHTPPPKTCPEVATSNCDKLCYTLPATIVKSKGILQLVYDQENQPSDHCKVFLSLVHNMHPDRISFFRTKNYKKKM